MISAAAVPTRQVRRARPAASSHAGKEDGIRPVIFDAGDLQILDVVYEDVFEIVFACRNAQIFKRVAGKNASTVDIAMRYAQLFSFTHDDASKR